MEGDGERRVERPTIRRRPPFPLPPPPLSPLLSPPHSPNLFECQQFSCLLVLGLVDDSVGSCARAKRQWPSAQTRAESAAARRSASSSDPELAPVRIAFSRCVRCLQLGRQARPCTLRVQCSAVHRCCCVCLCVADRSACCTVLAWMSESRRDGGSSSLRTGTVSLLLPLPPPSPSFPPAHDATVMHRDDWRWGISRGWQHGLTERRRCGRQTDRWPSAVAQCVGRGDHSHSATHSGRSVTDTVAIVAAATALAVGR